MVSGERVAPMFFGTITRFSMDGQICSVSWAALSCCATPWMGPARREKRIAGCSLPRSTVASAATLQVRPGRGKEAAARPSAEASGSPMSVRPPVQRDSGGPGGSGAAVPSLFAGTEEGSQDLCPGPPFVPSSGHAGAATWKTDGPQDASDFLVQDRLRTPPGPHFLWPTRFVPAGMCATHQWLCPQHARHTPHVRSQPSRMRPGLSNAWRASGSFAAWTTCSIRASRTS